ncbi:acyl-CoA dehydrogenase [Sphingomonas jatrophae]|uniref:Acyl-CoA dehydrogenase n=1 Tax=Sphingomonas jatrophae TaxID=1166337 RepID=A0A1I6KGL1_9SPHN|nr:acyl-CoA dehydrogenase [Sphingomonas jatrophae]SFR90369.1 Acyl-CoA dehydrogenase [Sphingomonas jatrophae]
MNLDLTDEQRLMADTAERFFRQADTLAEARRVGGGVSGTLWQAAAEAGFLTMRVGEAEGGLGTGLMEAVLVCEAAGRAAAPIPLADGIAAARLLGALGGEAAAARLAALAQQPLAFAEPQVDRLMLAGEAVMLRATDGSEVTLAEEARASFEAAQAERTLLRAAWLVGAATQAIELAAAYATERKQFDRPIGSFQGVALPLADAITDIEAGRLLVWRAVWAIAAGRDDAASTVAMADWWLATAARTAVRRSLRTFGGYGLSIEYDIHLYFLAINRVALTDGDPEGRLALVGDRLWGGATTALPEAGEPGIDLGFGAKAEAYAAEVRAFFARAMTPELKAKAHHGTDGHDPAFHKELAAAGFAYPDWPAQWGGEGRSAMEITALGRVFEENRWTRVPIGCTNMGARMVMKFGSPELQDEVLPRLACGDALSCLGFTEPESGSDMYGARTRAVRDGDDWIITGQKMFTTGAHLSSYVLLIARTDADKPKHKGLTIFFVPMDLPGVSIQPVHTLQDERTNITFYDEVRIPDRYRLGEVDGGLKVMAAAMEIEHGGEGYHIHHHSLMEAALDWAFAPEGNARPIDNRAVRARLAKVATHLSLADLLCRRATKAGEAGTLTRAGGPMAKLFATESYMADAADLVALTAPASLTHATAALAEIEEFHRQSIGQTIYGGTSEVHRTIIAQHALGLPRST